MLSNVESGKGKNVPTLINICGSGRSGSTMLDVMLGNSPDAFSCGEVVEWFRPWRTHAFEIDYPRHGEPCTVWDSLKNVPESRFHTTVARDMNVNFVVDSSKEICWLIDVQRWAAAQSHKVFNLLIWKNPVDMAYSRWKQGDRDLSRWRTGFKKYHNKILEIGLPFFAVNYNDLVNDPSRKLAEICTVIGMPYFEGKERFWEKKHCHLFGSLGIRRQIEAGHSVIQAKKPYPPEFQALVGFVKEQVSADEKLGQILKILEKNNVASSVNKNLADHQFHHKVYPWWYYAKRLVRFFQRYFPKEFDPFAREAIETVPLRTKE